ncbi:MAG: hypothetical protein WDA07_15420 [Leucobacter sp.]
MAELLALLAAAVPIAASLWVAGAALVRHRRSDDELRKRYEIEREHEKRMSRNFRMRARYGDPDSTHFYEFIRAKALERAELKDTRDDLRARVLGSMSETPMSDAQRRDQWILLFSAVAGIVLLALSLVA